jgi:putative restriction endonuclease
MPLRTEREIELCANHHRAFDRGLFCVSPDDYVIHQRDGQLDLRLSRNSLAHLKALPHRDAIAWRWARWNGESKGKRVRDPVSELEIA